MATRQEKCVMGNPITAAWLPLYAIGMWFYGSWYVLEYWTSAQTNLVIVSAIMRCFVWPYWLTMSLI